MADQLPDIKQSNPRGIFIPYEKLLEQIDHKLDRIADKIEDLSKSKVDTSTFESFKNTYEQRHERLVGRVTEIESGIPAKAFKELQDTVLALDRDKVGRDAVKRTWGLILGGGVLAVIAVTLQAVELIWGG